MAALNPAVTALQCLIVINFVIRQLFEVTADVTNSYVVEACWIERGKICGTYMIIDNNIDIFVSLYRNTLSSSQASP